ncbi:alpha-(1-_3)-arabinofuranosyltransferase domain-containing protein, partial [Escherichia coli]|uniref:alpha-(1->3)-arabinofuranosyltransferase domain-containing protein n=1 Tax=Escherichia coli TaxID=562 RepID=UPI0028DEAADF
NALSGTTTWLSFLTGPTGPSWPAGWEYVTTPVFVVLAMVPVALGLAGLSSRRLPERTFLALAALAGLALVTLGHVGSLA